MTRVLTVWRSPLNVDIETLSEQRISAPSFSQVILGAGQPLEEHDKCIVLSTISVVFAGESNMTGGTKREREGERRKG